VALWLGLLLVILGAIYASHARLAQWDAWQREPGLHLANGVPMMTTLDAYYSLRIARLQRAGHLRAARTGSGAPLHPTGTGRFGHVVTTSASRRSCRC
jgi:hypothetical protein